jgi:hypothetical protein
MTGAANSKLMGSEKLTLFVFVAVVVAVVVVFFRQVFFRLSTELRAPFR